MLWESVPEFPMKKALIRTNLKKKKKTVTSLYNRASSCFFLPQLSVSCVCNCARKGHQMSELSSVSISCVSLIFVSRSRRNPCSIQGHRRRFKPQARCMTLLPARNYQYKKTIHTRSNLAASKLIYCELTFPSFVAGDVARF